MAGQPDAVADLLADLKRQGIILRANGDQLNVKARRPILPATLREIAANKPALLAHLTASLAEAEAEYHRLWLRGCGLDDQLQAAKADGDADLAARLRAELSTLIDGPYWAAKLAYDAALALSVAA